MEIPILADINQIVRLIAEFIEVCGVIVIIVGGVGASYHYLRARSLKKSNAYENYRESFGRSILLGLEILVAGDIIGTVAIEPTYKSLGVLGLIVLIRTFLSFSLEVEINGRWPWQRHTDK